MGEQYQQPYQQPMQPQPSAGAKWGPTSIGSLEAHIAAGLGYFFTPILPLIFFFMEKTNKFVRFHAMQSILLGALEVIFFTVLFVVWIVLTGVAAAADNTGILASLLGCLGICVFGLAPLAFLGLWLWGMIGAFTGKVVKLPIIGNLAANWSGGDPQPMM